MVTAEFTFLPIVKIFDMPDASPPLVSVLVVTYNQANYIEQTIDSLIQQDYPNVEIIVADDASTDGTADLIQRYLKKNNI